MLTQQVSKSITLQDILNYKYSQLDAEKHESERLLKSLTEAQKEKLRLKSSIIDAIRNAQKDGRIPVIAEIKKRSPSQHPLHRANDNVVDVAEHMVRGGACGISVVTENKYFGGCLKDIIKVKLATNLPVMRKDFIIDKDQIEISAKLGVDVLLLISSVLRDKTKEFVDKAYSCGIEPFVEVRNKDDMKFVLKSKAKLIGINNREIHHDVNLKCPEIDLQTTKNLAQYIPRDKLIVSESGIKNIEDLRNVCKDADAALIGEAIMGATDVYQKVYELVHSKMLNYQNQSFLVEEQTSS